jgi:flagellar P-ring protein precursor FlgI
MTLPRDSFNGKPQARASSFNGKPLASAFGRRRCEPPIGRLRLRLGVKRSVLLAAVFLPLATCQAGVRIKDITQVEGERGNHLRGVGLVVGLDGTGGKNLATQQMAVDMLHRLRVGSKIVTEFKTDNVFKSNNIAMVIVTAELPPFGRKGSSIDVTVSAIDAESLQGGVLLPTPLDGADGETYAVAQGSLAIGGFGASGKAASAQKNHLTVGRIPDGAIVEREALGTIHCDGRVRLLLRSSDFATARAIAKAIDEKFPNSTRAVDPGTVQIQVPKDSCDNVVGFVGAIGLLEITPDAPARVVVNERTGTVVAGEQVKISTVAIAHGNLAITTAEEPQVSQPLPFSEGETTVVDRSRVDIEEKGGGLQVVERSVTVADLARALNALGVSPRDLISIFQNLKQAGALHAELVMIK